ADPALQIELRRLDLQSLKTPFTFETELRTEVAAHASNGNSYFDRQFNVRTRKDGAAPPYEKDSNALVNTAVTQALEDLLSDEQLVSTLTRRTGIAPGPVRRGAVRPGRNACRYGTGPGLCAEPPARGTGHAGTADRIRARPRILRRARAA